MKKFFQELFEYDHHFNQQIIEVLEKSPEKVSEKCISVISHLLNSHCIWNNRIQYDQTVPLRWDKHELKAFKNMERINFEHSMRILHSVDLKIIITYKTEADKEFHHSVRDLLFQIINHSAYHRGQLATMFRENGLEPLLTDYIYYKMTQN